MSTFEKIKSSKAAKLARQGWLVYLGTYGVAFDALQASLKSVTERRDQLVKELAERGDSLEDAVQDNVKSSRERAEEFVKPRLERVNGFIGRKASADDERAIDLADEIAKLNKKIDTLSKKLGTSAASVVTKPAAPKPTAAKPATKTTAQKAA